jgi:hypothetical protein
MASYREYYESLTTYLASLVALCDQRGTPADRARAAFIEGYRLALEHFQQVWGTGSLWHQEVVHNDFLVHMDRIKAKIAWHLGLHDMTTTVAIRNLRDLLRQYGIRQADLEQPLRVHKSFISDCFSGKRPMPASWFPDLVALVALARDARAAGDQGRDALAIWAPTTIVSRQPSGTKFYTALRPLSHLEQSSEDCERYCLGQAFEMLRPFVMPDSAEVDQDAKTLEDLRQELERAIQVIYARQLRQAKMPLPRQEHASEVGTSRETTDNVTRRTK